MSFDRIFKWIVIVLLITIACTTLFIAFNLDDLIEEVYSINERISIIIDELTH